MSYELWAMSQRRPDGEVEHATTAKSQKLTAHSS
jgi:hypothetical protein